MTTRPTKASPRQTPPKAETTPPTGTATRPTGEPHVTLAVIIGAHGITGEVRLKVFANDLSDYRSFNDGALTLKSARDGSNGVIARFAEVTDRNAAEALRGTELTVPRSALPPLEEGEYYHADIIGLPAIASDGEELGHVALIENFGAGDVLEIERPDGRRFMVPMNAQAVPEWDQDRLIVERAFIA
ncbi:ribosome maturation factor RimM [Sphingomonas sp. gentR]|jgi:16S rRNA processing protein RimM|uniref:ribosome maturation factor RimM n=1 Tax=unclassified Sphingomonas TaxID=196159 RepID=UPI001EEE42F1|nr:ribosome maturation factor RimM [Sphingomonas sp. LK11]